LLRNKKSKIYTKNAVFWDVALCRYCVNGRFGGTYRLHLQGRKIRDRRISVSRWLQTAATCSSETSVHTRSTQSHIPEDGILHSHSCESLKSEIYTFTMHTISILLTGTYRLKQRQTKPRNLDSKKNLVKFNHASGDEEMCIYSCINIAYN
jgi:hypothetical protein